MKPRHIVLNPPYKKREPKLVDPQTYATILDTVVIACVDIIVCYKREVLLGKRKRFPIKDWWLIGGRMFPGEKIEETASRKIKEEIGLTIAPERFRYLTTNSVVHGIRHQPPQKRGYHCLSIVMAVNIHLKEKKSVKPNDEYSEVKWVVPQNELSKDNLPSQLKIILADFRIQK